MTQGITSRGLLLVDTDVAFRDELSIALQRFGISLVWRARVLGLLESIAEAHPLALVLGGDLPGGEPIHLIRSIRAQTEWTNLPVYLVGTNLTREDELQAFAAGADGVLERSRAVPEITARALGRRGPGSRDATPSEKARASTSDAGETGRAVADAALDLCAPTSRQPDDNAVSVGEDAGGARREPPEGGPPSRGGRATSRSGPGAAGRSNAAERPGTPLAEGYGEALPIGVSRPLVVDVPPARDGRDAAGTPPATPPIVPDVVIVEDDPSLLEMLRYALSNRGYQTLSFSNGLDALRALREMDTAGRQPVVLLDVDLPGIDGFRILHELSGSRPGVFQVILCTVHNSEATQVLGIQSGALDYLVKPLRMPIVLAKVERLVGLGSFKSAAQA